MKVHHTFVPARRNDYTWQQQVEIETKYAELLQSMQQACDSDSFFAPKRKERRKCLETLKKYTAFGELK